MLSVQTIDGVQKMHSALLSLPAATVRVLLAYVSLSSVKADAVHCTALHQAQPVGTSLSFTPLFSFRNRLTSFVFSVAPVIFVAFLSGF